MSTTSTLSTAPASNPRAWSADTIDTPDSWYYRLSDRALAALDQVLRENDRHSQLVTDFRPTDALRGACEADLAPARDALEWGRGFAMFVAGALQISYSRVP